MHETLQRLSTVEALRRLAVSRDPEAWGILLEDHGPWLLGIARRFTRDDAFAEDIVQEVLLHIRDHAGQFEGSSDAAARAWIARVACNLAISLLRTGKRREQRDRIPAERTPTMDASEHYEWSEVLQREIVTLPESLRRPVVLRYFAGLSLSEIATELRLTESAVKNRVTRAVERLRKQVVLAGIPISAAMIERGLASTPPGTSTVAPGNLAQWNALLQSPRVSLPEPRETGLSFQPVHAVALAGAVALVALTLFLAHAAPVSAPVQQTVPQARMETAPVPLQPKAAPQDDLALQDKIQRLIENLNSSNASDVEASEATLASLGLAARPAVQAAQKKAPSRTLARVLRKIDADQELKTMVEQRAHHTEIALANGGSAKTEQAVSEALAWLSAHQDADGHWSPGAAAEAESKYAVASTSLALLALLGSGNSEDSGPYAENVHRGVSWLIEHQSTTGAFLTPKTGCYGYEQPMAATAVAEAAIMSHHPATVEAARRALTQASLDQCHDGAWRYTPLTVSDTQSTGDLSITSWYAQFLYLARGSELNANDAMLEKAANYLAGCESNDHGFHYTPGSGNTAECCTAMGAYGLRLLCGTNTHSNGAAAWLLERMPANAEENVQGSNFKLYATYFKAASLANESGPEWERWRAALNEVLPAQQIHAGDEKGSVPYQKFAYVGTVGSTALATLSLESYYRIPKPK